MFGTEMSLFIIKINTMRNMVVVGIMLLAYFCPDGAKFPPHPER